jgi:hypothetical protein
MNGRRRRSLLFMFALVMGLAALLYFVFQFAPDMLAPSGLNKADETQARNDVSMTIVQFLGGVVLTATVAIYTARNEALNRRGHEIERAGQITERLTRAVDQIGNPELTVRLGGIYAMEDIAVSSHAHRREIIKIFQAYVREHAPWPPAVAAEPARLEEERPPATDVQEILTVLARRPDPDDSPLDLSSADLRRMGLSDAHFARANFQGSSLRQALMQRVNLAGAHLRGADLREATLADADLRGALLAHANLRDVDLSGADLRGADFTEADLEGVRVHGAQYDASTAWPDGFDRSRHFGPAN